MSKYCISCGVENESQAKFCRSCGEKLDKDEYKHFNEADSSNNIKKESKDLSLWYLLIPFFISCFSHIQNWAVKYDKEDVSIIDFALYMLSSGVPEVYGELLGAGIAPILFSLVIVGIVWLVKRVRSKTYSNVKLGLFIWSLIFSLLILASGIWNNEEKSSNQPMAQTQQIPSAENMQQTRRPYETVTHNGVTYETVTSPKTGKVWLDRNLGASQVCTALNDTACYGDYYQWGRNYDGHQLNTSATTSTQATDINSAGTDFITSTSSPDWTTADSDGASRTANWSATDGSSICPVGYRIPTITELSAETTSASTPVTNSTDAFNNFLKLPSAGYRYYYNGSLINQGSDGYVWSSSVSGSDSYFLDFYSSYARTGNSNRAFGFSVRCLKD